MNKPTIETLARRLDGVEEGNRLLKRAGVVAVIAAVVLGFSLIGVFRSAFGEEAPWGVFTYGKGDFTYEFLENHEFVFREKRVGGWVPKKEGVWQTGAGICWLGEKGQGSNGNLMLYVGTTQCCLQAHWLGKSLVLSKIWQKPSWRSSDFCSNQVLIKAK